jgi:hypothetical protein
MDPRQLQQDLEELAGMAARSQQRLDELATRLKELCEEVEGLLDDPESAPSPGPEP